MKQTPVSSGGKATALQSSSQGTDEISSSGNFFPLPREKSQPLIYARITRATRAGKFSSLKDISTTICKKKN